MSDSTRALTRTGLAIFILATLAVIGRADLTPEWVRRFPVGTSFSSGIQDMAASEDGVVYVTGIAGGASNTDAVTAAYRPDGSLLWSRTYNGPANWHDQGRGIALGSSGELYVTGTTTSATFVSKLLLLKYDASTGALLNAIQHSGAPLASEHGASVATDAQGNVYVAGATDGDGADALVVKFDAAGTFQWQRTWDGPARSPYSLDTALELLVDPDGNPVVLINGIMSSLHPDFVVVKYAPNDGSTLWEAAWGGLGEDAAADMEIDLGGDVYVTGTAFDAINRYSTIKLDGDNGQLLWQAYDNLGLDDQAFGLALDRKAGVYITGAIDPDGDDSNFNERIYTVKRDAFSGALLWTHAYGDTCVGCFDSPTDVAVDPDGHVFVSGTTSSAPYNGEMITLVLDADTGVELDRGVLPGTVGESAGAGEQGLDGDYNLFIAGQVRDSITGLIEISVVKYTSLVSNLYALDVTNLIGGATANFVVSNATPLAMQYVLLSLQGPGSVPVPSFGITLNLESPILILFGSSDALGTYSVPVQIPAGAIGRTVWLQAAERDHTTPVLRLVVN